MLNVNNGLIQIWKIVIILLINYIQLYHNETLVKIFTEDRTEYIDALTTA